MSQDNEPPRNYRTVIRSCRFTPDEWSAVQERAAAAGMSPSRFLRSLAVGAPLGRKVNSQAVTALNRVGVNLNNLIRLATRSGQPFLVGEAAATLEELRGKLRDLL